MLSQSRSHTRTRGDVRLDSASTTMARFAAILLVAAALLLVMPRPFTAPSTAEVFWRAVLPGSAVPDAVLRLLRPGQFSSHFFGFTGPPSDTNARLKRNVRSSRSCNFVGKAEDVARPNAPFNYQNYKRSSAPYGYDYKAPSTTVGARDDDDTPFSYDYKPAPTTDGHVTRDDTPFSYSYKAPGEHHHHEDVASATSKTTVFFHEESVRVGERLAFHFPAASPAPLGLLPRNVADAIPFTTSSLPSVLALLGVSPSSVQAAAMAETLRTCESSPTLSGGGEEAKFCATSALGTRDVRAVTSTLPRAGAPPQEYAVRAVRRIDGESFVACHDEAYPYTVYRAYVVEMEGARDGAIAVATVCHTDTSRWNPEHVSFKLLGTKPGGAPICHLMPTRRRKEWSTILLLPLHF
ncbi:hypothetical protein HU200_061681 [Digitaria exilis]|uniref:BURP domain-containing protein n=1 Tax=Digitaria exilis TaxID=1010633 RepID=A0A835E0J9_9POAL|nr:hypothetical protein HU200_061681 [Digitaria exilis]